jgi:hypothetical protein
VVLEELEPRGLGSDPIDYMGRLLWLLLVEGNRHKPHDALKVVEGHGSEGSWCLILIMLRSIITLCWIVGKGYDM